MRIILASASPRRRELLKEINCDFEVIPAKGEERPDPSLSAVQTVKALAKSKCDEVFLSHPGCVVIGCDTVVVYGGKILGKPKDGREAEKTLKMLSGKTHSVLTGVCVRCPGKEVVDCCKTEVDFNVLSDEFIKDYVASGSPLDKAGSYGIQDGGVVAAYRGSYTNVVGLPVELLSDILSEVCKDE